MARQMLRFFVRIVQADGGGKLWGSKDFQCRLFEEAQVVMEPTRGENSAANGKAECVIDMLGIQVQLLLYTAGLEPIFWCFALLHATITLTNIKPCADSRMSPHGELLNTSRRGCSIILAY
jgi:hypothetical protein